MSKMFSLLLLLLATISPVTHATIVVTQRGGSDSEKAAVSTQARNVYAAIAEMNWRALHGLIALSTRAKAAMPADPDEFAAGVQNGFVAGFKTKEEQEQTEAIFKSISEISLGQPVIEGHKASVPTSAKATVNGRGFRFKGIANMIKDAGVWKLDLTYTDDVERATSEQVVALIGKPEVAQE